MDPLLLEVRDSRLLEAIGDRVAPDKRREFIQAIGSDFQLVPGNDGRLNVVAASGRSVSEQIDARLAQPEYASYAPAPRPQNLGQAMIVREQARLAAAQGNQPPSVKIGRGLGRQS